MSTELFDAKQLVDDIHEAAKVPESRNTDIYNMTRAMIGSLILEMDRKGVTMNEQRRRMGEKKDELIRELIALREQGIVRGEKDEPRKPRPVLNVNPGHIRVRAPGRDAIH